MFNLFFMIKTLILTFVILVIMQVRVGEFTLEQRAMFFVHDSPVVEPLREVAEGSTRAVRNWLRGISQQIGKSGKALWSSEDQPGNRNLGVHIKRSQAFLKEQAEKAKRIAEEEIQKNEKTPSH